MRQVRELAYRTRHVLRAPPKPRWHKPLLRGLLLAGCALVLAATTHIARSSGLTDRLRFVLTDQLVVATDALGMRVADIFTEGRHRTGASELYQILEPYYGQNVLTVDIAALQKRLQSLPWVRDAIVSRQLPDRLWAKLVEHRPIALWDTATGPTLVSDRGDIIRVAALGPYRALPILSGADAPAMAPDLVRLVASEPDLARRVTGAERVDGRRWNVFVDGRIEVRLPERGAADAWARLARLDSDTAILTRAVDAIDLRLPDRVVVRLDDALLQPATPRRSGQAT